MKEPKHISFKAPMNDNKHYWTVRVFDTLKELRWWGKNKNMMASTSRIIACVNDIESYSYGLKSKRGKKSYSLGEMLLYRKRLGSRIVVHECVHAAFAYINRVGVQRVIQNRSQTCPPEQEAFCYLVGDLSAVIYSVLYGMGVI